MIREEKSGLSYLRSAHLILALTLLWVPMQAFAQAPTPAPGSTPDASAAPTVGPNEVVMTVGDVKLTMAEFEKLTQALPPEVAGAMQTMGKRGFAERYASLVALAKEGEKQKLDQDDYFKNMVAFQRLMLLAQITVNGLMTNVQPVSPEEVSYYYTEHLQDFQQVNLRGIYVAFAPPDELKKNPPAKPGTAAAKGAKPKLSEDQAKAKIETIRLRLRAGESMATIAKTESDDPTASKGGDFGWVRRNQFTTQIDNIIFNLEEKQASIPIRDRFGYYIFQSQGKRTQPLEEAKVMIENGLRQQKVGETMQKVQDQYPVKLEPRYFGAEPPAPSSPAAASPHSNM